MNWKPISEKKISKVLLNDSKKLSDRERNTFEAVKIYPEKWELLPWSEKGHGFWVVAVLGSKVFWYNDIECGFNVSKYKQYGLIGEYYSSQDTFSEAFRLFLKPFHLRCLWARISACILITTVGRVTRCMTRVPRIGVPRCSAWR